MLYVEIQHVRMVFVAHIKQRDRCSHFFLILADHYNIYYLININPFERIIFNNCQNGIFHFSIKFIDRDEREKINIIVTSG